MRGFFAALTLTILSGSAFAHGNRAEVMASAVTAATKKFVSENAGLVKYYKGVRGWIQGTDLMVEIHQINTDSVITYTCKHVDQDGQMKIECR